MTELETVVGLFAALEAGEVEEALELVDPEVEWSTIGLGGSGMLRGRDATRGWFEEFGRQPGRIHVEVGDVFSVRGWVVALGTVDDNRTGLSEVSPVGWNLRVSEGLVTEAHGYDSWSRALEAAGGWTSQVVEIEGNASSDKASLVSAYSTGLAVPGSYEG